MEDLGHGLKVELNSISDDMVEEIRFWNDRYSMYLNLSLNKIPILMLNQHFSCYDRDGIQSNRIEYNDERSIRSYLKKNYNYKIKYPNLEDFIKKSKCKDKFSVIINQYSTRDIYDYYKKLVREKENVASEPCGVVL